MVPLLLALALLATVIISVARAATPHRSLWLCIHGGEGRWNDPDPPYYGGLQMSIWFQRTYGPDLLRRKGTADRWTPGEQMMVAERGYRRSGYSTGWLHGQWPVSSRRCV
jgi:hypothetical protein